MFTVLLGKRNRLFHQIRSQDSTLISVLLNAVLTVSHDIHFFLLFETYRVRDLVVLVGHKWAQYIPSLSWMKDYLPSCIRHNHMDQTRQKTETV